MCRRLVKVLFINSRDGKTYLLRTFGSTNNAYVIALLQTLHGVNTKLPFIQDFTIRRTEDIFNIPIAAFHERDSRLTVIQTVVRFFDFDLNVNSIAVFLQCAFIGNKITPKKKG